MDWNPHIFLLFNGCLMVLYLCVDLTFGHLAIEHPSFIDLGNFNHDLTATSLEIMVSKGNYPQMALIQVSEIL